MREEKKRFTNFIFLLLYPNHAAFVDTLFSFFDFIARGGGGPHSCFFQTSSYGEDAPRGSLRFAEKFGRALRLGRRCGKEPLSGALPRVASPPEPGAKGAGVAAKRLELPRLLADAAVGATAEAEGGAAAA